jgi:hypothetical protein
MHFCKFLPVAAALLFSNITMLHAQTAATDNNRFCLVPVAQGETTQADHWDSWRIAGRVVVLPGISRPIIYAQDRGGQWTIDETRTFVRLNGRFPINVYSDNYAHDPESGVIAGVHRSTGLFVIRPGEAEFTEIERRSRKHFPSPYSIIFVPRWKRFVISGGDRLYTWGPTEPLSELATIKPGIASNAFDLPAIGALLIRTDRGLLLRFDDGRIENFMSLDKWEPTVGADISADGSRMTIYQYRYTITLTRNRSGKFQTTSFDNSKMNPLEGPFDALPQHYRPSGAADIPPEIKSQGLVVSAAMPRSRAVIVFTRIMAYAIDETGKVEPVQDSEVMAGTRLSPVKAIIPPRDEMLIFTPKGLGLIVDRQISGAEACRRSH